MWYHLLNTSMHGRGSLRDARRQVVSRGGLELRVWVESPASRTAPIGEPMRMAEPMILAPRNELRVGKQVKNH